MASMSDLPAIIQIDANFATLYYHDEGSKQADKETLKIAMSRFRKGLSFNWLTTFQYTNPKECLSLVISVLLHYTENDDATLRVNSYSTLGALLLCVAPFSPLLFIRSFGHATSHMPVSPKASIAIINMFVYLSRFVSPVRMNEFVSMVPVLHHFGVDVSDYIAYLPNVIPKLKDLPVEFHQNILRSILVSCGRKPNFAFTNSVYTLICLNKQKLLHDLISFCTVNNLESALIWLGPSILADSELYNLLGDEGRELFLGAAINEFIKEKPSLTLFEYSCKIANIMIKHSKGTDLEEAVNIRIRSSIREKYPSTAFEAKLLFLPTPLSEIKINEKDPDSLRGAKLNAVTNYFLDNLEDADAVSEFFAQYESAENDLYCTYVDCFSAVSKELLERSKDPSKASKLLDGIIKHQNKNWVQDEAVAKLLHKLPVTVGNRFLAGYEERAIDRLLSFSLSSTDRLRKSAMKALVDIASYSNLDSIIQKIARSNWLDESECCYRFLVLERLSALFMSPSFGLFIDTAYECLDLYEGVETKSNIYAFLSHVPVDHMPDEVRTAAFSFIASQYQSFAQRRMEAPNFPYNLREMPKPFIETIDTDIVSNPHFSHEEAMLPTKHAFGFLKSLPGALLQQTEALFWASFYLVPLLNQYALDAAGALIPVTNPFYNDLWNLALETFKATSKDEVAAACVRLFVNCPRELPPIVEKMMEKYLSTEGTDPELVFLCFVIVDQVEHDIAMAGVQSLIDKMTPMEASKLLFKLTQVMGARILKDIKDEHAAALLQYALDVSDTYAERVRAFFDNTEFCDWPIGDPEMDGCTSRFMQKRPKIKIADYSKLDSDHWEFVIQNLFLFEIDGASEYIESHLDDFKKINVKAILSEKPTKPFSYDPEPPSKHSKASSLRTERDTKEAALIAAYCASAKKETSTAQTEEWLKIAVQNKDPIATKSVLTFIGRTKSAAKIDCLIECDELMDIESILIQVLGLQKTTILELDQKIKSRIEKKLGKIEPELILKASQSPLAAATVRIEPKYFVQYIIDIDEYRAHRMLKLIPVMAHTAVDADQIVTLLKRTLPNTRELTSHRKRLVFIRYITAALTAVKLQRKTTLFHELLLEVNRSLPNLTADAGYAPYSAELCALIGTIAPFVPSHDECIAAIQAFTAHGPTSTMLWMPHTAFFQATKNAPVSVTQQQIDQALQTGLPSLQTAALRALINFLQPSAPPAYFSIIKNLNVSLSKCFGDFGRNFRPGQVLAALMQRIVVNTAVDTLPQTFFALYVNSFVVSLARPSFAISMAVLPRLVGRVGKLYDTLWLVQYSSFAVVDLLQECYNALLEKGKSREDLFFEFFERVEQHFMRFPSFEMGQFLIRVITDGGENVDAASYLFSKLPMTVPSFLPLFEALSVFFKDAKPGVRDYVSVVVEGSIPIIQPKSRGEALRRLIAGESPESLIPIAAAETDEI